jgi:hypothetical protein
MKTLVILGVILGTLALAARSTYSEGVFLGCAMAIGVIAGVVVAAKSHSNNY